jgi:hypothetical protein
VKYPYPHLIEKRAIKIAGETEETDLAERDFVVDSSKRIAVLDMMSMAHRSDGAGKRFDDIE